MSNLRSAKRTFTITPAAVEAFISSSCKYNAGSKSWAVNVDYKRELLQAKPQGKQASLTSFFKAPPVPKAPAPAPSSPVVSSTTAALVQEQSSPVKRKAEPEMVEVDVDTAAEPSSPDAKLRKIESDEVVVVDDEQPAEPAVASVQAASVTPATTTAAAQKRITDLFARVFALSMGC